MAFTEPKINRRHLLRHAAALAMLARAARGLTAGKKDVAGSEIFSKPMLLDIKLAIPPTGQASLREEPRKWIQATVAVNGQEFSQVGVRLKSVTSFLPLDKKPSFTLNLSKFVTGQRLLGLRKLHLNNSVQDSSFMNEDLAGELFRRAGVPAARVAWAKVRLNERDLGLYVLKEGFAPELLKQYFSSADGNLYESGTHQEITDSLELDSGEGPKDRSDLKALCAAAQIPDLAGRWQALQKTLDVDRFVSMMAMESLTCHIDGYSLMQNNYRIYFDPVSGRAVFLVHGMDQMFGRPDAPLEPVWRGLVTLAVQAVPEGRKLYRQKLIALGEKVLQADWMSARLEAAIRVVEPADAVAARDARLMRERVVARAEFVKNKLPELAA